ncbi:uncharacterized protein LOC101484415 isoform X4 [Maylandia zebra]|uniref:uncharacterized protein LOC101484415 isoform X4 n=1 Tax=Maylandia zebra TaxID=106582 RepID=UPI00403C28D4
MITVFVFWIPALWFTGTQGGVSLLPLIVRDGKKVSLPCSKCSFWRFTGSNGAAKQELINQMSIGGKVTSDRLSVNTDCSLVITKVTVEDAGRYTCTVPENTGRNPGFVHFIDLSVVVIRMHGIMEPFAFSPHLTSEETNSTTMSKNNTNTAVTEKKPGDNNSSISTPENCEHTKVKWIHNITVWCRLIVVVVSLATLITVVLIVNILTKAVAKAKMDGNMGYNEEDDETVKQENAQPSDEYKVWPGGYSSQGARTFLMTAHGGC